MTIYYEKDKENIITLTIDQPDQAVNIINEEFLNDFQAAVDRLAAEEEFAGVILTSGKKTFLAGADIKMLEAMTDAEVAFTTIEKTKAIFRRLETLGKPVVAALNGTALGGGLEAALACHYRVALDDSRIRFGFPEVTLGILPGGGGVTRLVRMIGLQNAFPLLTEGTKVDPRRALEAGIIDALAADPDDLFAQARTWIHENLDAQQPWDQKGFKIPGGGPNHPQVAQVIAVAPAALAQNTRGNYPAPEAILSTMVEGAMVDFDTASRIETRYFTELVTGKIAKNMLQAFWYQLNEINKGGSRPAAVAPQDTNKVGILGAGMMGHGIAYVSALAGLDVVLKDVSQEKAEQGKSKVASLLQGRVDKGRLSTDKMVAALDRIMATDKNDELQGCDLIVEAVFEDRDLKATVTQETEQYLVEGGIFASNTSTLPITGLAQASSHPENFIGLHFFSPVQKMKLVEIIVGEQTSDETQAKAFDFVLKIGKIPIVVNDSRGFYTSRVFTTYIQEGGALLMEGQPPQAIEAAGLQAGMPVGPLAILDEVNLGLSYHIREQTRKDFEAEGKIFSEEPIDVVLDIMINQHNRPGKAQGAGFYEYPRGAKKFLWPQLSDLFPTTDEVLPQQEMIERLMFIQALETVRCFAEGVVNSVPDANIGSIFGWGFAPFKGGTLQYINDYGLPEFVTRSRELAKSYGNRFKPPELLVEMAENRQTF